MMYFMNIFFIFIFYRLPSGLNLYYTLFNVLTILQQKYLTPHQRPLRTAGNNQEKMISDTIVAPATPYGIGGIAVVRLSGPQAISFCISY